jgi:hypothetical protein
MLAALTLCLLEALEQAGIERGYAIELTGDTCWRFYRHWGRITKTVTSLISRDPTRRVRLSVNAFLTYPFGRPGYRFDAVPEEDGRSLNMVRCPVADYLGQREAADLCAGSWCNLDYALAEMWGASLHDRGQRRGHDRAIQAPSPGAQRRPAVELGRATPSASGHSRPQGMTIHQGR